MYSSQKKTSLIRHVLGLEITPISEEEKGGRLAKSHKYESKTTKFSFFWDSSLLKR